MKKIVSAGIGGRSFSMEEDAYAKLKSYLNEFRRRADMGNMTTEVMDDVEARISELFSSRIYTSKESVSLQMVEDVISQLGMPDGNSADNTKKEESIKDKKMEGNKKFYRDPDTKAIGGVCGGLAAYFDIDIMLIRIIFIALLLAGTAGFWAYLILWIVAPMAKTAAQKCELRGLPVTAENLARFSSSN